MFKRLFVLLYLLGSTPIFGQNGPHQKLDSDEAVTPWAAVGRLDIKDGGFCTGALISPRLVLTAAHCVYSSETGKLREPATMIFKAGYRNGDAADAQRGRRLVVHNEYNYVGRDRLKRVATDVALIELENPIAAPLAVPFDRHYRPLPKDKVLVVSYARGRENVPSLEDGCQMLRVRAEVLFYSCDIDFGSSGAPVFVITNAGPKIASVMSSGGRWRGEEVSLGASVGPAVDALLQQLAVTNPESRFISVTPDATTEIPSLQQQLGRDTKRALPQIKR